METELKSAFTALDGKLDGIGDRLGKVEKQNGDIQKQVDTIELRGADRGGGGGLHGGAVKAAFDECEAAHRLIHDKRGSAVLHFKDNAMRELFGGRKTTITEIGQGFMTTGVMPIERIPGITPEARQQLMVRDLLYARPTTQSIVDFVKVSQPMGIASPVPEASTKPENAVQFTSVSERVRTIASWIPASKQILDDMTELMGYISTSLPYYVNLCEELQLLSGDATGENLHGLIPQATPWVGGLPAGSTRIDAIGSAVAQIQEAREIQPTFAVVNPKDMWAMRLLKDSLGRYILGAPSAVAPPKIFDLDVSVTTSIAPGSFLVGSGSPVASEIRDRMEMAVEISTEHSTFFVQNLVAIRAEKRLALVVKRPASYVFGSFAGLN
ncbi:MAG TPA: phage major capsid protein [Patescibacteria group bacterium]|nr:phage major capsid protein [Patescibacteria group bacterium]